MFRIAVVLVLITITAPLPAQNAESGAGSWQPMPAPKLPFLDWKACPFEGCTYGRWTARKSVTVYNTWQQKRRAIAQLSAGDQVVGLTGLVVTARPGVVRMDHDLPGEDLRRGDTILTYTYRGEGVSAVWFKGRYYSDFDLSFTSSADGEGCVHDCAATYIDLGKKVWWAQVKLNSGQVGWVDMTHAEFDGVDALARAGRQRRAAAGSTGAPARRALWA